MRRRAKGSGSWAETATLGRFLTRTPALYSSIFSYTMWYMRLDGLAAMRSLMRLLIWLLCTSTSRLGSRVEAVKSPNGYSESNNVRSLHKRENSSRLVVDVWNAALSEMALTGRASDAKGSTPRLSCASLQVNFSILYHADGTMGGMLLC